MNFFDPWIFPETAMLNWCTLKQGPLLPSTKQIFSLSTHYEVPANDLWEMKPGWQHPAWFPIFSQLGIAAIDLFFCFRMFFIPHFLTLGWMIEPSPNTPLSISMFTANTSHCRNCQQRKWVFWFPIRWTHVQYEYLVGIGIDHCE